MFSQKYGVNNISFLHPYKERNEFISSNQVDNLKVCLNTLDNKAYLIDDLISKFNSFNDIKDNDLIVKGFELDEYDDRFVNIVVHLQSRTRSELYDLFQEFNANKALLIMNHDDFTIEITKDGNLISMVKKVYPVAIKVNETDYLVHHNFYNGLLSMKKIGDKYVLYMTSNGANPLIIDLIMNKFGENVLIGDSKEELLERFYNGFT